MTGRGATVHWIGAGGTIFSNSQQTACGRLAGFPAKNSRTEYETVDGSRFEAVFHSLKGVTCKGCIRVINSRGGRNG